MSAGELDASYSQVRDILMGTAGLDDVADAVDVDVGANVQLVIDSVTAHNGDRAVNVPTVAHSIVKNTNTDVQTKVAGGISAFNVLDLTVVNGTRTDNLIAGNEAV